MKQNLIDRFFTELDRELGKKAEIILTGAAAGSLLGILRPSVDIDFEIRLKPRTKGRDRFKVQEAVRRASHKVGIAVNYSEDIGRWSMIDIGNYRETALPYQKMGQLEVKIIAPEHWTIGKMGRFYTVDIRDVLRMIRRRKLKAETLIPLWGKALHRSPLSLALGNFRRNITYFIECHGKEAWGKRFDPEQGTLLFQRAARIR